MNSKNKPTSNVLSKLIKHTSTLIGGSWGERREVMYVLSEATKAGFLAPFYLRPASDVGPLARTKGRPVFRNFGRATIGEKFILTSYPWRSEIVVSAGAELVIGDRVSINTGVSIGVTGNIYIGSDVRIGPQTKIMDNHFHEIYDRQRRPAAGRIVIEDYVWVGAQCIILPNVRIGRASVIGAGSIVTKDIPAYSKALGAPASVVGEIDQKKFESMNP